MRFVIHEVLLAGKTFPSSGIEENSGDARAILARRLREIGRDWPIWDRVLIADRLAVSLCLVRDRLALSLARTARAFVRGKTWATFGYSRLDDHARERFDRSGRWVRDLSRLADVIERLPEIGAALTGADGGRPLGRVVALLAGGVATPDTVAGWIDLARTRTVREFRELVRAGLQPGNVPELNEGGDGAKSGGPSRIDQSGAASAEPASGTIGTDEPTEPDVRTLRFALPRPVMAAFDEARELYSALSDGHESIAGFVEALLMESAASGDEVPEEVEAHQDLSRAERECRFAKGTERWAFLRRLSDARELLTEADHILRDVDRLCQSSTGGSINADACLRALINLEDEIEAQLGDVLSAMGNARAWSRLMFAGLGQYAAERLGVSRTTAENRMRLSRVLRGFPVVREAYQSGELGGQAAAIVGMILGSAPAPENLEDAWVEHAISTTIRRLRDELRVKRRELVEREGAAKLAARASDTDDANRQHEPVDDETWRRSLIRRSGDAIERVATYGSAAAEHSSWALPVFPLRLPVELAAWLRWAVDAKARSLEACIRQEKGGMRDLETASLGAQTFSIDPSSELRARIRAAICVDAGSNNSCADLDGDGSVQTFSTRSLPTSLAIARRTLEQGRGVPEWVGLFALIEDFVRTWDDPSQCPKRRADAIYVRDGWRCSAPGCTSRARLEDHHIVYLSHLGSNAPWNRICLCSFHHHQGQHGGLMTCRGRAPLTIRWTLGDEGIGGVFVNDRRVGSGARPRDRGERPQGAAVLTGQSPDGPAEKASQGQIARNALPSRASE